MKTPAIKTGAWALLTILWSVLMMQQIERQYFFPGPFHDDIVSPILAVELARNAGLLNDVICPDALPGDCEAANRAIRINTILDLIYIPLYAMFLWSAAGLFARPGGLRSFCRVAIAAAAAFDYLEDLGIFTHALWTCWMSLIKWSALAAVFGLLACILFRSDTDAFTLPTRRLLGIGQTAASVLLIAALFHYSWIPLSISLFSTLPLVCAFGFLGPVIAGLWRERQPQPDPGICDEGALRP